MNLSFETRRKLKAAGRIALILAVVFAVVWACWLIWVDRYMVYTRDGAQLDFSLTAQSYGPGTLAVPPEATVSASIYVDDGSSDEDMATVMSKLEGYYIDYAMLTSEIDTVRAAVSVLPVGSAVMMEVKSIRGNFYYTSSIDGAKTASGLDVEAVDRLIADMTARNLYVIATVPAFRDRAYGLSHTNIGLPYVGGDGALWLDEENCYWLDPGKNGTLAYLQNVANELRSLGFDEVMFTDFRFPETDQVEPAVDPAATIQNAAQTLTDKCTTDSFALSFLASDSTIQDVEGRSRLYLKGVDAAGAAAAAQSCGMADPSVGVVFITDSHDTRYDAYGALRPITSFVGNE